MTIGQYVASFTVLGVAVVAALLLAIRRSTAMLLTTTIVFIVAAAAFFQLRPGSSGVFALKSTMIGAVAITVAAVIVYLRRANQHPRGSALTGVLALVALIFAWFETAYLLR